MNHFKKAFLALTAVLCISLLISGNALADEPRAGMFDPWFNVETNISYSSGTTNEWAYGNQQKEFSTSKPCYVRVGSAVQAVWHWGWAWGDNADVTITYRLTGISNCDVDVSDGFLTSVESDDPNVMIFTKVITAKKWIIEEPVIFQYTPKGPGSLSLEVIYDDTVKSEADVKSTVYFVDDTDYE